MKMKISFFCLISSVVLIVHQAELVKVCGRIFPDPGIVHGERPFTAYCVINQTCLREDASRIYWLVKGVKVPETQYEILNQTTSSVTFENLTTLNSPLTCNVMASGHVANTLYGIFFTLGLPPDKPTNLTCIVYNQDNLTCTWDPGRPTNLPTNYTLSHRWAHFGANYCRGANNSCTIHSPGFQFYIDTTFQVEATNELGIQKSETLTIDPVNIVKPNPPQLSELISSLELPNALKIEWKNPITNAFNLKYNIRYRPVKTQDWEMVPEEDTASHRDSFTLQDLLPNTVYEVSIRCIHKDGHGFWSDWSELKKQVTPEAPPSRGPDIWKKIDSPDANGNRDVMIMWKNLSDSVANGEILLYSVTFQSGSQSTTFNVTGTSYKKTLSKDLYSVSVTAYNRRFASPPSKLNIPRSGNCQVLHPEFKLKAFPKDKQLWVEWTPQNKSLDGYIIEWCNKYAKEGCVSDWQRESRNVNGTFLRGELEPHKCYWIKVYQLYKDGCECVRSEEAYLQQGTPIVGPSIHTNQVEKHRAIFQWTPVPFDKLNGFIRNYTLIYKPNHGNETAVVINPQTLNIPVGAGWKHTVLCTHAGIQERGGKDGPIFTFTTLKFANGEVEAIVVSCCVVFLILVLIAVILCFNNRDLIKKHIWPNVPDPSKSNIAQWSPQTPNRHDFNAKGHPFQDGSFTDVSVVEITAKQKPEQDIKSMDPLKKNTSEPLSSGIGGSSCLSSPRLSASDCDEVESAQTTSSTVQYSTVIISGYRDQQPSAVIPHVFSRSESTQPLLDCEERPEEPHAGDKEGEPQGANQYFKQNCGREDFTNKLQALHQEEPSHFQEQLSASDLLFAEQERDFPIGQSGQSSDSQLDTNSGECKSYMPQTVKSGGYMPQ
ncbi:interleukin 6 cytokine family signal transducer S homeolog precursor [Xenopus laevis]|uniref:Gp130p1 n=1 Tax=Xenopus laevis TaxID=8355 RepID=O57519_XENLA|nr:interleukin 6 cytokine family signal transducer S homeolog precursor [Xenopus laevis]AAC03531.1 gp130p1 [Xenopus laevis]